MAKLEKVVACRRILANHTQDKLPFKLAYSIMKFMGATEADEKFYADKTREMLDTYAEMDESGVYKFNAYGYVKIKEDMFEEYKSKQDELDSQDVPTDFSMNVSDLEAFSFTVDEVKALEEFIKE